MNQRYVDAMARAMCCAECRANGCLALNGLSCYAPRIDAGHVLTALIAELRADPGAVEAIAHVLESENPALSTKASECLSGDILAALCDYMESPS